MYFRNLNLILNFIYIYLEIVGSPAAPHRHLQPLT